MPAKPTLEDFSRIVGSVYSSVMVPENWTGALADLQHLIDAQCALVRVDEAGRTIRDASLKAEARADYENYYRRIDYVLEALARSPIGVMTSGRTLVGLNSQSEFNIDWLRPLGMADGIFVRLTDGVAPLAFLTAGPRPPEPYAPLVRALVPHLQQALRSHAHLKEMQHRIGDLGTVTRSLRQPVITVTTESRIVYANEAAEAVLRSDDGLRVRDGRLEAVSAGTDTVLQHDLGAALTGGEGHPRGSSLLCARRPPLRPYVIEVLPVDPVGTDAGAARRAMVVVIDPELESAATATLLRRHYRLTAGEVDIAVMVLRGGGAKDIAERLSLSQATVKTHLQHIFDKTGVHRQSELVRLLSDLRSPYR
ncbi:helix-turn-helix transcriptional regulator [[Mycobacterium] kokjensenii]|uniref:Helix-turn-helix transcriptional regulator n=1 Tax=[Mycobacterium] kokjensenii TaxID=3064287 RepID=A0ABM9LAG5_9MYCO|nr:helix-turn-helix transcriptional regulator [Mycolicibacter sp. MU0083]CAJ1495693.1 helix-turn-helix transcriptional regulator [Mycolicibacter sp. MU0083]